MMGWYVRGAKICTEAVVGLFQFVLGMNTSFARRDAACSDSGYRFSCTNLVLDIGSSSSIVVSRCESSVSRHHLRKFTFQRSSDN